MRRLGRWVAVTLLVVVSMTVQAGVAGFAGFTAYGMGTPGAARGTGHDAIWLGHAWVDGRRTRADVDALAARLRTTGIRDLFVHAGPFSNDGTLDPALRPRARWFVDAVHAALPGVRVQAWLGAYTTAPYVHIGEPAVRARLAASVGQVLDDGFDGVHLDYEPVEDGDPNLIAVLRDAHAVTRARGKVLSLSASLPEPVPGVTTLFKAVPGAQAMWSPDYLHRVASEVDQIAIMMYDSWMLTRTTYVGYVRRGTAIALAAVPPGVALLIGVPAYHEANDRHRPGVETVPAALDGVRLALGAKSPDRVFGVALYVDFAATEGDWTSYRDDWVV